jgi:hypothetical protein
MECQPAANCKRKEMVISLSLSSPKQCGSCIKNFAQRKRSKTRRKKTRKYISCDVGSVEKLIKEEAEDTCKAAQW